MKLRKPEEPHSTGRRSPAGSAWPSIVIILMQMALGGFSIATLSAIRGFVSAESIWSKAQHEAVYSLDRYLETGDVQFRDDFRREIAMPLAILEGRRALDRLPPDDGKARSDLIAGGVASDDVPAMLWMYKHLRGFPALEAAIGFWRATDAPITELDGLGRTLAEEGSPTGLLAPRRRVDAINDQIIPMTLAFDRSLGRGARLVERLLLYANVGLAGILAILTIWRIRRVVSQRLQFEQALAWQASHDDLTGLPNRRAFERRLTTLLDAAKGGESGECALLIVDLDQFKVVNDTCGHAAGDALLKKICPALTGLLRPDDLVARLGGDEFSIVMPRVGPDRAFEVAEAIRCAIENIAFGWNTRSFRVTASVGLVHDDLAVTAPEEMMAKADVACFTAKEKGRNRVHRHQDDDQDMLGRMREMNWVQRIHEALEADLFTLYAQEIVPLKRRLSDGGIHIEVLVRMKDENGNLIPPLSFLPAAERFGLIKLIDRWVVRRAFASLADRQNAKSGLPITCCSINLSGATLGDADFLDFLKHAFAEHAIAPEIICFEVTETSAIVNLVAAQAFVRDLRSLGCTFALDDFGSGMSSFNYLKELPVDYLKIDGAFVKTMMTERSDRAMVEMICHVGHVMGKRVVAEYVETSALEDELRGIGVDYGQGFGIAPPRPFDARFDGIATAATMAPFAEKLRA